MKVFLVGVVVLLLIIVFYRQVPRYTPKFDDTMVLSPTYGKLITVQQVEIDHITYYCMSFRLGLFDIHRQTAPYAGRISKILSNTDRPIEQYYEFDKRDKKQGSHQLVHWISTKLGDMRVDQFSNWYVRRIDSFYRVEDMVKAGDEIGIIHFGSRVDLYVPKIYYTDEAVYNFNLYDIKPGDSVSAKQPLGSYKLVAPAKKYTDGV